MTVGERIMHLRKARGLSRTEFAYKIGIPGTTLRNYELGVREPGHSFIIQMAREFNVSTDYLLGLTEDITTQQVISKEIKQAPELNDSPEAKIAELTLSLTNLFVQYGWIAPGKDITDEQLRFLKSLVAMVDAYFNG